VRAVDKKETSKYGLIASKHRVMSRVFAILFAIFLFGLVIMEAMTEQNPIAKSFDTSTLVLNISLQILLAIGLILYCGFAALHSTQYVTSPQERSLWLILTIGLNVLGSCWYFLTVYQTFRRLGKGRLMSFRKAKHA
jgi:hypothetical protein